MIRKRITSILPTLDEQMDLVGDKTTCDESKRRIQKLKQSPFPEERFDKENAHSDMADIKRSLDFASEVPSQPANRASLEPTIKPSNVLELQRQLKQCSPLVTKQQPKCQNETDKKVSEILTSLPQSSNGSSLPQSSNGSSLPQSSNGVEGQAPLAIRSMWDSVVTFMKSAVDFMTDEPTAVNPVTTTAASTITPAPQHGQRKRPMVDDCDDVMEPAAKAPKTTQSERHSSRTDRRKSLGAFPQSQLNSRTQNTGAGRHPLLGTLSSMFGSGGLLPLQSPAPGHGDRSKTKGTCHTPSLMGIHKKLDQTEGGLNCILEETSATTVTASQQRIRNPALRKYYAANPNSSVTIENGPVAPPPSLPPRPPPPPPPPLPPPGIRVQAPPPSHTDDGGVEEVHTRAVLQRMQHRLRNRMKKKGGDVAGPGEEVGVVGQQTGAKQLDVKIRQWAEIQSYSRKIPLEDFLDLVTEKKRHLISTLECLQASVPTSLAEVSTIVEVVLEGSQWFPGGSKEMREELPVYKALEGKIEALNEFLQVTLEMEKVVSNSNEFSNASHVTLQKQLGLIRDEFNSKHQHWSTFILTAAEPWTKLGLPVQPDLLRRSQLYLCQLVQRFVQMCIDEATKITGILVSIKCVRATHLKDHLRDCLSLLTEAIPYFLYSGGTQAAGCEWMPMAVGVVLSFVKVTLGQFDGFVCRAGRQEVCEHFEGVLKVMGILKSLVMKVPELASQSRNVGLIAALLETEELSVSIYSSCVKLIQHIASQGQAYFTKEKDQASSREVVLWMMFGCKYVNQMLEAMGSQQADERGMHELLGSLQQIENLLPE